MTLVDSHCHLEMIADTAGAVAEARGAGVEQLVTIGIDLETSRQAAEMAATLTGVYATVGHRRTQPCAGLATHPL